MSRKGVSYTQINGIKGGNMTPKKLKKGDRVITTGYGRTKDWGNNTIGTVSKRRGEKVFVVWENTIFHIEDEMDIKEVKPYEKTKKK